MPVTVIVAVPADFPVTVIVLPLSVTVATLVSLEETVLNEHPVQVAVTVPVPPAVTVNEVLSKAMLEVLLELPLYSS